ncbi:MAG: hypothetical protein IKO46_06995 [Salinivirgaceae bacterium]|nr:hypothetical protein [Salinivirgaceae bacterium]
MTGIAKYNTQLQNEAVSIKYSDIKSKNKNGTCQFRIKVIVEPISITLLKENSNSFFNARMATIRVAI